MRCLSTGLAARSPDAKLLSAFFPESFHRNVTIFSSLFGTEHIHQGELGYIDILQIFSFENFGYVFSRKVSQGSVFSAALRLVFEPFPCIFDRKFFDGPIGNFVVKTFKSFLPPRYEQ